MNKSKVFISKWATYYIYVAWLIAIVSVVGSLYFSNVVGLVPCVLCWYQRIAIYPLALIIPIGLVRHDETLAEYILWFGGIGWLFGLYQVLLQYGFIHEATTCSFGVSCISDYYLWHTFLTIPLLSFVALSILTILSILVLRERKIHG